MEQTLDTKDIQVLDTGKVFSISSQDSNYAYLGGDFSTNPNDYVEILIYDTNNNFLESSTVDESDYKSNPETGLKINTGTVLRKLGYDRGRYVVKYNFFRRAAGSNETVLVNTDGTIYTGEPIINSDGVLSDLETIHEILQKPRIDNPIILMAGGLGKRLLPLTEDTPKPLLKVGTEPILETLIKRLSDFGFYNFYI